MKQIWMVNDDAVLMTGMNIALQSQKLDTRLFSNAYEFLRQLAAGDLPGVIVLDAQLSGVDTVDLLRVLSAHPRFARIPVIVIAGEAHSESHCNQMLISGAAEIVRPDVATKEFRALIKIRLQGMSISRMQPCVAVNAA